MVSQCMAGYVEHCNLSVRDLDACVKFIQTALPDWKVRGGGEDWVDDQKRRWLHIGTEESYLALQEALRDSAYSRSRYREPGINHIGIVVDDAQGVRDRLLSAGYREMMNPVPHMHRQRIYFTDPEGNEFEFIEYYSEDPGERNDYSDEGENPITAQKEFSCDISD